MKEEYVASLDIGELINRIARAMAHPGTWQTALFSSTDGVITSLVMLREYSGALQERELWWTPAGYLYLPIPPELVRAVEELLTKHVAFAVTLGTASEDSPAQRVVWDFLF